MDCEARLRIFKLQFGWSAESSTRRAHVQGRAELGAQPIVIGPQRKWISELGGCVLVHQIELLAPIVQIFLQHPRFCLRSTIGERDAVEIVLDHSLGFRGSLLG